MGSTKRVWELAEELGVTSAAVLNALPSRSGPVITHLSTLPSATLEDLRRTLQPPPDPDTTALRRLVCH